MATRTRRRHSHKRTSFNRKHPRNADGTFKRKHHAAKRHHSHHRRRR